MLRRRDELVQSVELRLICAAGIPSASAGIPPTCPPPPPDYCAAPILSIIPADFMAHYAFLCCQCFLFYGCYLVRCLFSCVSALSLSVRSPPFRLSELKLFLISFNSFIDCDAQQLHFPSFSKTSLDVFLCSSGIKLTSAWAWAAAGAGGVVGRRACLPLASFPGMAGERWSGGGGCRSRLTGAQVT